jgi:hypothetical protein
MQKISVIRVLGTLLLVSVPYVAFAALSGDISSSAKSFSEIVDALVNNVIRSLVGLALSSGLVVFLYGVLKFILAAQKGDATEVGKGREFMGWGLVALFVMFSVYGIVNLAQSVFFNNNNVSSIRIPDINMGGSSPSSSGGNAASQNQQTGLNVAGPNSSASQNTAGASGVSGNGTNNNNAPTAAQTASVQKCVADGGQQEVCTCEIVQGGVWNLSGNTCDGGSSSSSVGATGGGASNNPSAIQTCINNGGSQASCDCEINQHGAFSVSDGSCSTGASSGGTSSSAPSDSGSTSTPDPLQACIANGGTQASCDCEINQHGVIDSNGNCATN